MANIMQQVKLKNHVSRDAFDLSHRNAFTAKVGELLPVSCIEVIPGDSYNLGVQHFTRTQPVNTAAYTRIREYFDWFFVPTDLLWNKFGSFVTQMVDNNQHASGINTRVVLSDTHPYFTTSQIHNMCQRMINTSGANANIFNFRRVDNCVKLLNYLDYGNFNASTAPNSGTGIYRENVAYNPFPLLAYQKIYQDYFRNSQWEKAYAPAFNIDYMSGSSGTASLQIPVEDLNLSNGTETMFDLRYANWHKDLFMGLLPNAQYGAASIVDTGSGSGSLNISFADTLSYDTQFFVKDRSSTDPLTPTSNIVVGSASGTDGKHIVASSGKTLSLFFPSGAIQNLRTALGLSTSSGSVSIDTSFSILALRQAEALQKWKEITQSQQQDYKSQVEAHFGVSPDNGYSDMCRWIDGSVSTLDISEVTNTNITADNAADIAGKGVGVGQSRSSFKSNVHGYLMCIYHAVPLLDYAISGVNRQNLKTKATDYAIPEFDRTGMVSVPVVELTNSAATSSFNVRLLGYAPRYYDYKQKIDRVHGGFVGDLSHWVAPVSDQYLLNYLNNHTGTSVDYSFFKINPATMNPIFAMSASSSLSTDQLLVNSAFDVKAVRNLDRNGLPY